MRPLLYSFLLFTLLILCVCSLVRSHEAFKVETGIIYALPKAGLCNRLRVVACVDLLARRHNRPFRLLWMPNTNIPVRFDELFTYPYLQEHVIPPGADFWYSEKTDVYYPDVIDHLRSVPAENVSRMDSEMKFPELPSNDLVIASFKQLCDKEAGEYRRLCREILHSAQPFLADPAKAFFAEHKRKRNIAVHIRSVDVVEGKRKEFGKPTEFGIENSFLPRMAEKDSPDTSFFVCTDDISNFEKVHSVFPNSFLLPRKSWDRSEKESIYEAITDLYLMSLCDELIGTRKSSFSEFINSVQIRSG